MKIVFADMDGACANSDRLIQSWINGRRNMGVPEVDIIAEYRKTFNNCKELIFPEIWDRFKEILERTGAKVVWTSTWRVIPEYEDIKDGRKLFEKYGIPGDTLVGYTPNFRGYIRGKEIAHFLENNSLPEPISSAVIIDDRRDAAQEVDLEKWNIKFILTDEYLGLTEELKEEAIEWLNKELQK